MSMGYGGPYPRLCEAEELGKDFLAYLGVSTIEEARKLSAEEIRDKTLTFSHPLRWGPVVDGYFLADDPAKTAMKESLNSESIMVTYTSDESIQNPDIRSVTGLKKYLKEYFYEEAPEWLPKDLEQCDWSSLVRYNANEEGAKTWGEMALQKGYRVYLSKFSPEIPGDDAGVFHSSDLWFVFETLAKCWRPFRGKHYDLARQMCNYFTNFAKSGNPNGLDDDGTPMPEWRPYSAEDRNAMCFGDVPNMETTGTSDMLMNRIQIDLDRAAGIRDVNGIHTVMGDRNHNTIWE